VSIAEEVGARVSAIDPRLAWETGPGLNGAHHHFALSAEGDIELRVLTQRCIARAPAADATWEYFPARQAFPRRGDWALEFEKVGGATFDFPRARVGFQIDTERELAHVKFHHPALAKVDENQRATAAFLTLDSVLGEDGVERWIGRIETSAEPIPDGKTLRELAEA
jgi:hypothetical protein